MAAFEVAIFRIVRCAFNRVTCFNFPILSDKLRVLAV